MLTRLYCHNYKCLVNFEFQPAATQLLMGRNGAGKSTVFEVLELIRDFAVRGERVEGRFGGKTRTRWQDVSDQTFELDVAGNGGSYAYKLVLDVMSGGPNDPRVEEETLHFDGKPLYGFENGNVRLYDDRFMERDHFMIAPRRSYLSEIEARAENTKLMWFKGWLDRLLCVQIDPKRMKSMAEKEAVYPSPDLGNFAEWYRHLRQEYSAATDELRASLEKVIDGFDSLDLKGPPSGSKELQVVIRSVPNASSELERHFGKGSISYFGFNELSDGQRTLVGLYTLLHCALTDHSLLCIDEPDNFIALGEIQPWLMQLLDRAEATSSQLLIASHHPELLNQLATRNGIIVERSGSGPTRVRPFSPPSDTTLAPAEIVARGWEHV